MGVPGAIVSLSIPGRRFPSCMRPDSWRRMSTSIATPAMSTRSDPDRPLTENLKPHVFGPRRGQRARIAVAHIGTISLMDPGPNLDVVMPLSWTLVSDGGPLSSLRWGARMVSNNPTADAAGRAGR
jgi:hypothetical protein